LVGGLEGSEYERSLRRIVAEGGVTDRVHFHGYRNDSANFLAQAYVCVQPSLPVLEESFGRTVAEAMAAGVPAVVFRSGALQETVIHEETGLICNETTPECLAAALRRLLLDSSLRHRYGAAGRCRYEQLYSPEPVRALWLALLRGDTGAQRRRGHERPAP
jgi:glycosyltransferase involved in cell wall biosynthesis